MPNAPSTRTRAAVPWLVVATAIAAVVCLAGWPRPTGYVAGLITATAALTTGWRLLRAEHRDDTELTAEEARDLVDDLGLRLYRAEDALAYVAECCNIADREGVPVTTARVREWLKGPQCARQAGLVLTPDGEQPHA